MLVEIRIVFDGDVTSRKRAALKRMFPGAQISEQGIGEVPIDFAVVAHGGGRYGQQQLLGFLRGDSHQILHLQAGGYDLLMCVHGDRVRIGRRQKREVVYTCYNIELEDLQTVLSIKHHGLTRAWMLIAVYLKRCEPMVVRTRDETLSWMRTVT